MTVVVDSQLARRVAAASLRRENWIQFLKFGVVGGLGYLVNLAAFALLVEVEGINHIVAAVLSFCIAVANNFVLNRTWTFARTRGGHAGFQAARFFAVSVGGLGINLVVLFGLVDLAGAPALASQATAVAVAMPFNFIGNKLWTFGPARVAPWPISSRGAAAPRGGARTRRGARRAPVTPEQRGLLEGGERLRLMLMRRSGPRGGLGGGENIAAAWTALPGWFRRLDQP